MSADLLTASEHGAVERLAADLVRVFGTRLHVVVAYRPGTSSPGEPAVHTLALADRVTMDDLAALLTLVPAWHKARLATPLLLGREEFERTLDVFPIEYESILASHVVIRGAWPAQLQVENADLRRACERQVKGHLIHLREGFLETHGRPAAVSAMLRASVPPFRSALRQIARLEGAPNQSDADLASFAGSIQVDAATVRDVLADGSAAADATELLSRYIQATEQLWRAVDRR